MSKKTTKPELLAPAGSLESFFAAMESGADAVYAGLKAMSARAKAKNFSLKELEQMLAYAHAREKKIYVTLNTLVKEKELPALVEILSTLEAIGTDAVILQDMAVWQLAHKHFPGLNLHSSTQMTIHNTAGIKMLESLGFERAVLARELTLEEIAVIRSQTEMELEHFVHGALCFSFSGQCYFSSFLGGKSGNRGRCAQPCRRRYRHRRDQGYYFSTNDLSAIDLLDGLVASGVGSFKIEGRMKSAEYVANVVGAYRSVIDAAPKQRPDAIKAAKEQLKDSFGRPPTKGFLPGESPPDIAVPNVHGATGRFLGKVEQSRGKRVSFRTGTALQVGDRVRIQPQSDQAGKAFTLKELYRGQKKSGRAKAGDFVTVVSPFGEGFRKGDAVFKVSSHQAFTLSDAACRRLLSSVRSARQIDLHIGMPDNGTLELTASAGAVELQQRYPVEAFPARERPIDAGVLQTVFSKGGKEAIELQSLTVDKLPPVVIPPSRMKEIRRDFFQQLQQELAATSDRHYVKNKRLALDALLPKGESYSGMGQGLMVGIRSLGEARLIDNRDIDRILVPLEPGIEARLGRLPQRLKKEKHLLVWDLPFIILDRDWPAFEQTITALRAAGWESFRLNNLAHFKFFEPVAELELSTGFRLFSLNSQAALSWQELGVKEVTLYLEDDRENIIDLLQRKGGPPFNLVAYSQVPMMTTRVPMPRVRPDSPLVSGRDEHYLVKRHKEISTISAATDFSLLGHLHQLRAVNFNNFTIDLSHLSVFSPPGKGVLAAYTADRPVPSTSLFNFDYGME
jgi:putative protease